MLKFILKRLLQSVPVLVIIMTATFFMMHLAPGGPFDKEKKIREEVLKNLEAYYGLDLPVWKQYWRYAKNVVLHGDLGPSFRMENWTVNELIADGFPVSLELGVYALAISLLGGITLGVLASLRPNSWRDYLPMSVSMAGICIPSFVLGPLLLLVFAMYADLFNASGWFFPRDRVLPALTLGTYYLAYVSRLTRGGMLDVLNQDYIRTAAAKGASKTRIVFRHGLKGGLMPVISFLGPAAAGLLTGSFVVETIFQIPGLGRFFVMSAFNRDYTVLLGSVLFYATLIILFNLIVDVVLIWLNPKLRFE